MQRLPMKMHIKYGVLAMVAIHIVLALSTIGATIAAESANEEAKPWLGI